MNVQFSVKFHEKDTRLEKVINKFTLVSGYGYVGPRVKKLRFLENGNLKVPL